jgi:malonate decarboxylase acyl carrier protein
METIELSAAGHLALARRAFVGVVASGDCEVLIEPAPHGTHLRIVTSVTGFRDAWSAVFARFAERHPIAAHIEINDFGATPAVVALRLEQAREAAS